MKFLRCLLALALICGFTSFAKADNSDFVQGVLDPPPMNATPIFGSTFSITFGTCPTGFNFDGCFEGENKSGMTFQSLHITYPNTSTLGGQPVSCNTTLVGSIFTNSSCFLSSDGKTYSLEFFGGSGLPSCKHHDDEGDDDRDSDWDNNEACTFVIVEDGVDPGSFPTGTGVFSTTVPVPEPGTMALLSTGMTALGVFRIRRRSR
jgi:hypothetical protein